MLEVLEVVDVVEVMVEEPAVLAMGANRKADLLVEGEDCFVACCGGVAVLEC